MGCGCKKNQAQQTQAQAPTTAAAQPQVKQTNVQESVKKIVEKYYKNK